MLKPIFDRRSILGAGVAVGLGCLTVGTKLRAQGPLKRVRLLLNTSFSGPQAWFLLADDLGYFVGGSDLPRLRRGNFRSSSGLTTFEIMPVATRV